MADVVASECSVVCRVRRWRWTAAAILLVAACSGDDAGDRSAPTVSAPSTTEATADGAEPGDAVSTTVPVAAPDDGDPAGADGISDGSNDGASDGTELEPLPEVGVPGLDDDIVVCRSWSRIAGSFQVVAVASAFGSGDPIEAARLEVIGSPVVVEALAALVDAWPAELASEAETVTQRFLGPYVRRAERARAELVEAGADEEHLDRIGAAWLTALAERDPESPVLIVDLDGDLEALVELAATAFDAAVPPVPQDPTLVTDVRVPATEAYVADRCPDRGTLGGTEVPG